MGQGPPGQPERLPAVRGSPCPTPPCVSPAPGLARLPPRTLTPSSPAESSRPAGLSPTWTSLHLPVPAMTVSASVYRPSTAPWSPRCERRDRSARSGLQLPSLAPGGPRGAPRSTLSERARPRLPQACQWRDVFRAAPCCACKAREGSFSLPLSLPQRPHHSGKGPAGAEAPRPARAGSWAAALHPGAKPHLPTLPRGCLETEVGLPRLRLASIGPGTKTRAPSPSVRRQFCSPTI